MINFSNGRDEIAKLLKLNKKKTKKLNFLIRKEIKKYIAIDSADDIEQNIFEGIIKFINLRVGVNNYDLVTSSYLSKRKSSKIYNKRTIKIINKEYNIIKINSNPQDLKFIIEHTTSSKYGKKMCKKFDILNITIDKKECYEESFQGLKDSQSNNFGIYDSDSEVDIEMKSFIDKYYQSLNSEEKEMFTKYFYYDTSYFDMIEMNYARNEYILKKFIKKTKEYFYNQLVG